jgi:hypothetical protein
MRKLLIPVITLMFMVGCTEKKEIPSPEYETSQIVYSVLDSRKGQITSVQRWCNETGKYYRYWVRFGNKQETVPGGLLSSGGPVDVSPYSTVKMWEFELTDQAPE